jgi:hypothetical protein
VQKRNGVWFYGSFSVLIVDSAEVIKKRTLLFVYGRFVSRIALLVRRRWFILNAPSMSATRLIPRPNLQAFPLISLCLTDIKSIGTIWACVQTDRHTLVCCPVKFLLRHLADRSATDTDHSSIRHCPEVHKAPWQMVASSGSHGAPWQMKTDTSYRRQHFYVVTYRYIVSCWVRR